MEPYNIWIFLVIAMATSQHLSAQKKVSRPASKYVPQKSLPYL
ncbi:hypothetical protein MRX96_042591, partial [Rhipicephalus microplus]